MEKGPGAPSYPSNPAYPGVNPGYPGGQAPPPGYQPQVGYTGYNVQPVTSVTVVRQRPNNYLVMAVLVTICCCLPFGIVGIVYSLDSTSKFDAGDDAGSLRSATSAKNWSIAGLVCGIVLIIVIIILQVTVLATTTTYYYTYDSY